MGSSKEKQKAKFSAWYAKNADALNAERKARYVEDETARSTARAQAARYRAKRCDGHAVARERTVMYQGVETAVFTTGTAAELIGTYPQKIINWDRDGLIPKPVIAGAQRLYLLHQVKLMARLLKVYDARPRDADAVHALGGNACAMPRQSRLLHRSAR